MNRLIEHICYLLLENDFVIVPDLGGFVVNEELAYCDYSKQTIFMPRCWVSFNNALVHNDGLLAQLYVKTQSLSYAEAESNIKEDVRKLKSEIASNGELTLGNWGCLYNNKEGIICFRSLSGKITRPHLLGLGNLSIKTLEELRAEQETLQSKRNRFSIGKTIAITAASVAAAAILFSISIPILDQKGHDTQFAGFFPENVALTNLNATPDSLQNKSLAPIAENLSSEKKDTTNDKKNLVTKDNYFLIVGTFKSESVANKLLADIQQKEINKCGIIKSPTTNRVYITSFDDRQTAINYLSKFVNENEENKDAWIYTIKASDKILDSVSR